MNTIQQYIQDHQLDSMRLAGRKVGAGCAADRRIAVFNPYTEQAIGSVPKATVDEVRETFTIAHAYQPKLTRFERAAILNRAAALIFRPQEPRTRPRCICAPRPGRGRRRPPASRARARWPA